MSAVLQLMPPPTLQGRLQGSWSPVQVRQGSCVLRAFLGAPERLWEASARLSRRFLARSEKSNCSNAWSAPLAVDRLSCGFDPLPGVLILELRGLR